MINKGCVGIVLLVLFEACSPTNTKITANPKKIGYRPNETILITQLSGISEAENEQLMNWANGLFVEKLPSLKTLNYWDMQYKSKQLGFVLPSFNNSDTTILNRLESLDVDFILFGNLNSLKENYNNELRNPNY